MDNSQEVTQEDIDRLNEKFVKVFGEMPDQGVFEAFAVPLVEDRLDYLIGMDKIGGSQEAT